MEVKVKTKEIKNAVTILKDVVSKIPPICKNVLIETTDDGIKLTTSDTYTTLVANITCDVIESGTVLVDANYLWQYLRAIKNDELVLYSSINLKDKLYLLTEDSAISIDLNELAKRFPNTAVVDDNCNFFSISAETLKNGISKVIHAASKDEIRPVMNGIFVDVMDESINFVASDSHKLFLYKGKYLEKNTNKGFILFKDSAKLILKILNKCPLETILFVKYNDKCEYTMITISTKVGNFTFGSQLIQGQYPNYKVVIPEHFEYKLTVNKDVLYKTVKELVPFTKNIKYNKIILQISKDNLKVIVNDSINDIFIERSIPCESNGEESIGISGKYLCEILESIDDDVVVFEFNGPDKMLSWKAESKDPNINVYVMPILLE